MYTRTIKPPKSSFFLLGARGTGKSTWLKKHFKEAKFFDLLDESLFQKFLVNPKLFQDELRTVKKNKWVVVDEVQRLPNLLNEVHKAIEELGIKFALTGSSARKLKRAGVNLLAGRARLRTMLPLLPQELGDDFNIEEILRWGSLPLVISSVEKQETLTDYVQLYLKEEINAEALVRNLAGFARSLPVFALFNGQSINIASLARDAEVERKTCEGYLNVLEDTLLAKRLYPYQAKLTVREKKKAKLYWIDPGIVRAAAQRRGAPTSEEKGALLESYIYQIIRHEVENTRLYDEVHYWSPAESKTEVDFLLKQGDSLFAIEVKSSPKIKPEFFKGLKAISSLKKVKRKILVYTGNEALKTKDNIEVMSIQSFTNALIKGL